MSFLKRTIKIWCAVAVLLAAAVPSYSSEKAILLSDDVLLKIGDAFQEEGEYYRAITEYKKLLILFPDSKKADHAVFNAGMSYFRGQEYDHAAGTFSSLKEKFPSSAFLAQSNYFEGLSYWKMKKYESAKAGFDTLAQAYPNTEYAPRALVAKSMIELDEENTTAVRKELERLIADYPASKTAANAGDALRLMTEYEQLPEKSSVAAGFLSAVVPGSGYVYAGNYEDGITAFAINALFIAGTVTAVNQRNYSTAYLTGAFGLPFYIGNIYGSANAAKKWNVRVRQEQRQKIHAALEFNF